MIYFVDNDLWFVIFRSVQILYLEDLFKYLLFYYM